MDVILQTIVVEGRDDHSAVERAVKAPILETHGFGIRAEKWEELEAAYKRTGLIIFTDPDFSGEKIRARLSERFPDALHAYLTVPEAERDGDIGIENASAEAISAALKKAHAVVRRQLPCSEKGNLADPKYGLQEAQDAGFPKSPEDSLPAGQRTGSAGNPEDSLYSEQRIISAENPEDSLYSGQRTGSAGNPESRSAGCLENESDRSGRRSGTFDFEFTSDDMIFFTGGEGAAERRRQLGGILGIGYSNARTMLKKLNLMGITREEFDAACREIFGSQSRQ